MTPFMAAFITIAVPALLWLFTRSDARCFPIGAHATRRTRLAGFLLKQWPFVLLRLCWRTASSALSRQPSRCRVGAASGSLSLDRCSSCPGCSTPRRSAIPPSDWRKPLAIARRGPATGADDAGAASPGLDRDISAIPAAGALAMFPMSRGVEAARHRGALDRGCKLPMPSWCSRNPAPLLTPIRASRLMPPREGVRSTLAGQAR